jgi:hypothetical protein
MQVHSCEPRTTHILLIASYTTSRHFLNIRITSIYTGRGGQGSDAKGRLCQGGCRWVVVVVVVLHCTVLYCTVLHCTVLYFAKADAGGYGVLEISAKPFMHCTHPALLLHSTIPVLLLHSTTYHTGAYGVLEIMLLYSSCTPTILLLHSTLYFAGAYGVLEISAKPFDASYTMCGELMKTGGDRCDAY